MLEKAKILQLLSSLSENTISKEILVPALKASGLKGARFTGGATEYGVDIEYYVLTQPEGRKSFVGIQVKKGSLVYQANSNSRNSVVTVKNQAGEAFEKEIADISGHGTHYIERFVVAVTGEINEPARKMINKARQKGSGATIDYWEGDYLATLIQTHWMAPFEAYFKDALAVEDDSEDDDDDQVIDSDYVLENHPKLVEAAGKVRKTVGKGTWNVLDALVALSAFEPAADVGSCPNPTYVELSDFLFEMETSEERISVELEELARLDYLDWDERSLKLSGKARQVWELAKTIIMDLEEADEDIERARAIFDDLIPS